MQHYTAPWSRLLVVISSFAVLLCGGISGVLLWQNPAGGRWLQVLPVVLLLGAVPFVIRGYSITADAILVHRCGWTTRLPLAGLGSARAEPNAMSRSIRLFGNGGLFSFTGLFRNKALGNYRAFVTDLRRTVVLRYEKRTVVISPGEPDEFVRDLKLP